MSRVSTYYQPSVPAYLLSDRMLLSDKGANFLKGLEGLRLIPYPDGDGYSIAWGHFIQPGEEWMMEGITRAQADQIFENDVDFYSSLVDSTLEVPVTQELFDALVMFAYNIGAGNFIDSHLVEMINGGGSDENVYLFWLYTYTNGGENEALVERRQKEADYAYPSISGGSTTPPASQASLNPLLILTLAGVLLGSRRNSKRYVRTNRS